MWEKELKDCCIQPKEGSLRPRDGCLEAELRGNYAGLFKLTGVGDNAGTEERT